MIYVDNTCQENPSLFSSTFYPISYAILKYKSSVRSVLDFNGPCIYIYYRRSWMGTACWNRHNETRGNPCRNDLGTVTFKHMKHLRFSCGRIIWTSFQTLNSHQTSQHKHFKQTSFTNIKQQISFPSSPSRKFGTCMSRACQKTPAHGSSCSQTQSLDDMPRAGNATCQWPPRAGCPMIKKVIGAVAVSHFTSNENTRKFIGEIAN